MGVRIAAAIAAVLLASCRNDEPAARPNILLIVADDLGLTDVGFFGSEIPTPNLDALAADGLRFTNFHVAPSCQLTRAMLMSGTTHREAGVVVHNDALLDEVAALPERLRGAGYHTYMAGKWNLGIEASEGPRARGFERSYALTPPGDNHLGRSVFADDVIAYREDGEPVTPPDGWFSTRLFSDKLLGFIEGNAGDGVPWFGYLAFTAPHWPLQAPDDWLDRHEGRYDDGYDVLRNQRVERARAAGVLPAGLSYDGYRAEAPPWRDLDDEKKRELARAMEIYAAMTENMDMHIGRVVDYLRDTGQLDDTVIVFMSDNGASGSDSSFVPRSIPRTDTDNSLANMGREGSFTAYGRGFAEAATAPYRAVKGSLHSGGTLAAAFVHYPRAVEPGDVVEYLTVMDVLPTFVQIAGGDASTEMRAPVRGESFWDVATNAATRVHQPGYAVPWITLEHRRAVMRWPWKLVTVQGAAPDSALSWQLFDLKADPGERVDVSGDHPDRVRELGRLADDYARSVGVQRASQESRVDGPAGETR